MDTDTDVPYHEEHVNAVREERNLHLEFYQPDVPVACGHPGNHLLMWEMSFQDTVKVPQNLQDTAQLAIYSLHECTY